MNPRQIRKKFSVVVERTMRELQGLPCLSLEKNKPHPRNIMVSRGFKVHIKSGRSLAEAVSFYTSRAAEKARAKKVAARTIRVSICTNPYSKIDYYSESASYSFPTETNDSLLLAKAGIFLLKKIFKPGLSYQKACVMLSGLKFNEEITPDFWSLFEDTRSLKLMETLDKVNSTYGRDTLRLGTAGQNRTWFMARDYLSPRYTTKWDEIRKID